MEIRLVNDYANMYFIEVNGVRLETELHYHEGALIEAYLSENLEALKDALNKTLKE